MNRDGQEIEEQGIEGKRRRAYRRGIRKDAENHISILFYLEIDVSTDIRTVEYPGDR